MSTETKHDKGNYDHRQTTPWAATWEFPRKGFRGDIVNIHSGACRTRCCNSYYSQRSPPPVNGTERANVARNPAAPNGSLRSIDANQCCWRSLCLDATICRWGQWCRWSSGPGNKPLCANQFVRNVEVHACPSENRRGRGDSLFEGEVAIGTIALNADAIKTGERQAVLRPKSVMSEEAFRGGTRKNNHYFVRNQGLRRESFTVSRWARRPERPDGKVPRGCAVAQSSTPVSVNGTRRLP